MFLPVPILFDDINVSSAMMEEERPAEVPSRFTKSKEAVYGFADASG